MGFRALKEGEAKILEVFGWRGAGGIVFRGCLRRAGRAGQRIQGCVRGAGEVGWTSRARVREAGGVGQKIQAQPRQDRPLSGWFRIYISTLDRHWAGWWARSIRVPWENPWAWRRLREAGRIVGTVWSR